MEDTPDTSTNSGALTPMAEYTGTGPVLGPLAISRDGTHAYVPQLLSTIRIAEYSINAAGSLTMVNIVPGMPSFIESKDRTSTYIMTNPNYDNYIMYSPSNGLYFGCIDSTGKSTPRQINHSTNAFSRKLWSNL